MRPDSTETSTALPSFTAASRATRLGMRTARPCPPFSDLRSHRALPSGIYVEDTQPALSHQGNPGEELGRKAGKAPLGPKSNRRLPVALVLLVRAGAADPIARVSARRPFLGLGHGPIRTEIRIDLSIERFDRRSWQHRLRPLAACIAAPRPPGDPRGIRPTCVARRGRVTRTSRPTCPLPDRPHLTVPMVSQRHTAVQRRKIVLSG
jgi:hypothetical protein